MLCCNIVELHTPDRVLCQFGMRQDILDPVDTNMDMHTMDPRRKTKVSWINTWATEIDKWNHRVEHVVTHPPFEGVMGYHDPYMKWYRRITRRYICKKSTHYNEMVRFLSCYYTVLSHELEHLSNK